MVDNTSNLYSLQYEFIVLFSDYCVYIHTHQCTNEFIILAEFFTKIPEVTHLSHEFVTKIPEVTHLSHDKGNNKEPEHHIFEEGPS